MWRPTYKSISSKSQKDTVQVTQNVDSCRQASRPDPSAGTSRTQAARSSPRIPSWDRCSDLCCTALRSKHTHTHTHIGTGKALGTNPWSFGLLLGSFLRLNPSLPIHGSAWRMLLASYVVPLLAGPSEESPQRGLPGQRSRARRTRPP